MDHRCRNVKNCLLGLHFVWSNCPIWKIVLIADSKSISCHGPEERIFKFEPCHWLWVGKVKIVCSKHEILKSWLQVKREHIFIDLLFFKQFIHKVVIVTLLDRSCHPNYAVNIGGNPRLVLRKEKLHVIYSNSLSLIQRKSISSQIASSSYRSNFRLNIRFISQPLKSRWFREFKVSTFARIAVRTLNDVERSRCVKNYVNLLWRVSNVNRDFIENRLNYWNRDGRSFKFILIILTQWGFV